MILRVEDIGSMSHVHHDIIRPLEYREEHPVEAGAHDVLLRRIQVQGWSKVSMMADNKLAISWYHHLC